jgi:hypothetical protein
LILGGPGAQLIQTIGNEEDPIDQSSVGSALDFKVAEKAVCTKEGKTFVEDVCANGYCQFECPLEGRGAETWFFGVAWRVGWAAETSVEGEEGYIANFPGVFFGEERGVVGLCVLVNGNDMNKPAWFGRRWRCRGAYYVVG